MATAQEDAVLELSESQQRQLDDYENRTDRVIERDHVPGGSVEFCLGYERGDRNLSLKVTEALLTMYRAKGWRARFFTRPENSGEPLTSKQILWMRLH